MVLVQHFLRVREVQVVVGHFSPGEVQHELDVGILDAIVRRGGVVLLQAGHFLVKDGSHFLGPLLFIGPAPHLFEFLSLVHAQLFLDGAELVVEVVFPLLLVYVRFHLLVDFLLDLEQLRLGVQHPQQGHAAFLHVGNGQQGGPFLEVFHLDGGGDEIHQEMEVVDAPERADGFLGGEGGGFHDEGGLFLEGIGQDAELPLIHAFGHELFQVLHAGRHVRLVGDHGLQACQLGPLQDGRDAAVRHFQGLDELAHGSVGAQIRFRGFLHGNIGLGDGGQPSSSALYVGDQTDAFLPSHRDRENGSGEDDGVPEGKHRQGGGKLGDVHFHGGGFTHHGHDVYFHSLGSIHDIV